MIGNGEPLKKFPTNHPVGEFMLFNRRFSGDFHLR
jgi:hypothetical protein